MRKPNGFHPVEIMTKATSEAGEWLRTATRRLAKRSERPTSEAQLILAMVIDRQRSWVAAHPEITLIPDQLNQAESMLSQYLDGEPLPYVLGHWEFFGLDLIVNPAVLIPRPETEQLVETALNWLRAHPAQRHVVDVGTGSGCIAAALAYHLPDVRVTALDISAEALAVAQLNIDRLGLAERVNFVQSDLVEKLSGPADVVCANLPYIPSQTYQNLDVARYEPYLALDGGADGMRLIERLLADLAQRNLCRALAVLELESSQGQAARTLAVQFFPQAEVSVFQDLAGHDRLLTVVMR